MCARAEKGALRSMRTAREVLASRLRRETSRVPWIIEGQRGNIGGRLTNDPFQRSQNTAPTEKKRDREAALEKLSASSCNAHRQLWPRDNQHCNQNGGQDKCSLAREIKRRQKENSQKKD